MTDIDIQAARALCDAATPGPLVVAWRDRGHGHGDYGVMSDADQVVIAKIVLGPKDGGNAHLFAESRALIPALCDELEAARKDLILQEAAMEARTQAWEAEVERLRGIVDKLPKTADGVPVVADMHVYYRHGPTIRHYVIAGYVSRMIGVEATVYFRGGGFSAIWDWRHCYSTKVAAEAAKDKEGE